MQKDGNARVFKYASDCAASTEMRPSMRSKAAVEVKKMLRYAVMNYAARERNTAGRSKQSKEVKKQGCGKIS